MQSSQFNYDKMRIINSSDNDKKHEDDKIIGKNPQNSEYIIIVKQYFLQQYCQTWSTAMCYIIWIL